MKVSKTMKNTKKNANITMGYTPVKALNSKSKTEPKSAIISTGKDMRAKAGK